MSTDELLNRAFAVNKPVPNECFYRPSAVQIRIEFLERHRATILAHMTTRQEDQDWHGVSDDANDLREVDAELKGLRFVARQP